MSLSGFESIIEGLLDAELLEDLKLFKGKNFLNSESVRSCGIQMQ